MTASHVIIVCYALTICAACALIGTCGAANLSSLTTLAGTAIGFAAGHAMQAARIKKKLKPTKPKASKDAGVGG